MTLRTVAMASVVVAAVSWVATRGLPDDLSYYLTPSEVAGRTFSGEPLRVGGLVEPGSVERGDDVVRFVLTDGDVRLRVVQRGGVPPLFRGGSGAIVEGTVRPDGTFLAQDVLVKHDEVYRVSEER
jgi:cytochrome c-type biogenesis protein CcmE